MSPEKFIHPIFGTPCSRQRRAQVLNMLAGKCVMHANRNAVDGSDHCEECLEKLRSANPRRARWLNIDWTKPDRQIADELGVTQSAVLHQRRKALGLVPEVKIGLRRHSIRPRFKNPNSILQPNISPKDRESARSKTRAAIESGKLSKKPCAVCDALEVEAHHFDYMKPLEIIWLCKAHHWAVHRATAIQSISM